MKIAQRLYVVFRVNSSPFMLNAFIRNHIDKYREEIHNLSIV